MNCAWLLAVILAAPSPDQLDRRGREAFRAGDYVEAAAAFGALLERLPAGDPLRAQTQYNRGRALQEAGRSCAAGEALFAYLSSPSADAPREARRRKKASRALARARADCAAQRDAPAREAPPPVAEPASPDPPRRLLLLAGLVSGAVMAEEGGRARTNASLGAGWHTEALIYDLELRLSVENPDAEAEATFALRPGARLPLSPHTYARAAAPLLVAPLIALGLHGGLGAQLPLTEGLALGGEAGGTWWLADAPLLGLEVRLGVEATF